MSSSHQGKHCQGSIDVNVSGIISMKEISLLWRLESHLPTHMTSCHQGKYCPCNVDNVRALSKEDGVHLQTHPCKEQDA